MFRINSFDYVYQIIADESMIVIIQLSETQTITDQEICINKSATLFSNFCLVICNKMNKK